MITRRQDHIFRIFHAYHASTLFLLLLCLFQCSHFHTQFNHLLLDFIQLCWSSCWYCCCCWCCGCCWSYQVTTGSTKARWGCWCWCWCWSCCSWWWCDCDTYCYIGAGAMNNKTARRGRRHWCGGCCCCCWGCCDCCSSCCSCDCCSWAGAMGTKDHSSSHLFLRRPGKDPGGCDDDVAIDIVVIDAVVVVAAVIVVVVVVIVVVVIVTVTFVFWVFVFGIVCHVPSSRRNEK